MRCDILLKTWFGDLCWISYALRFLERNWLQADSEIIVLAEPRCEQIIESWGFSSRVKYFYCHPWPDGNQHQCYLTLLADHFSDAELFAVFDSDTMLLEPMRAANQMEDGKPIIYFRPYDDSAPSMAQKMWGPLMEYWLRVKPQADYMQRFPFLYWASTIAAVRRLITARTGYNLVDSLYSDTPYNPANFGQHPFKFCEHNVIGFYAALHEPDRYVLRPVTQAPNWPVKQYHSWTDWSPERQAEFDRILTEPPTKMVTPEGWTVLCGDPPEGHSGFVIRGGKMDVDPSGSPQEFIRPHLKPGSIAIDVGAHIGNFTVPMARALGPSGVVLAFEPFPQVFDCLEANVKKAANEDGDIAPVVCTQRAVGATNGKSTLYANPSNIAGASLLGNLFGNANGMPVDVVTLDSLPLDKPVSVIKIDVEGGELDVLKGAEKLLLRQHPALFIETQPSAFAAAGITEEDFFTYLRQLGYRNFSPFPPEWIAAGHHGHDVLVT
jgi:FkbM family methyltransferase